MKHLLNILSIVFSLLAFVSVIWIIVPAPATFVWLFAVAVSEWSLWFTAIALIGIVCALLSRMFYGRGKLIYASIFFGTTAVLISLYPLATTLPTAKANNVNLSLTEYSKSVYNQNPEIKPPNISTCTFAQTAETELKLDVYSPSEKSDNGAAIIVIHGGSWSGGARSDFSQWNQWFAEQGLTVFDIDYRLAPQPNYAGAAGDVKCAVRWIKEHSLEFNISPDRIALLGRSAGAHLALLAAYSADDKLPATCETGRTDGNVRAVVSFYAPIELLWAYDNPANQFVIDGPATLSRFIGGSPYDSAEIRDRYVLASPTSHVNSATPPTLLIHGGQDQLVRKENMYFLDEKLSAANIPHKIVYIPYAQHGFDYNFNGWGAQIAKPVILNFIMENTRAR